VEKEEGEEVDIWRGGGGVVYVGLSFHMRRWYLW